MNPFKCRHCDLAAHFYFREGGMLCVDHAEAFCLAQANDMMQRSRLDSSSCGGVESRHAIDGQAAVHRASGRRGYTQPEAGVASGPQDSTPSDGRDSSDVKPAASVSSAPEGAAGNSFESGACEGNGSNADGSKTSDGSARYSFDDGIPDFLDRRKSPAFRVAHSSLIQASASSSDILNQPSSVQV